MHAMRKLKSKNVSFIEFLFVLRIVGGTVYPGLMITSGSIHYVLSLLNIPIHIRYLLGLQKKGG